MQLFTRCKKIHVQNCKVKYLNHSIFKHFKWKQIWWMHETGAQGWCTGVTQRNWVKREVGGGSGLETHVNQWLIHVNVWQKPLQYCKVISLQWIKINGKKNENRFGNVECVFPQSMRNPKCKMCNSKLGVQNKTDPHQKFNLFVFGCAV